MYSPQSGSRPDSPFQKASIISKLFFSWLIPLFRLGSSRPLESSELYQTTAEDHADKLSTAFSQLWSIEQHNSLEPSLLATIWRFCAPKFVWLGLLVHGVDIVIKILQPLMLGALIAYFSGGSEYTTKEAAILSAGIVISSALASVAFHNYMTHCFRIGIGLRISMISLIYKKVMRLTKSVNVEGLNGHVINLMANDVARFNMIVSLFDALWKGPLMLLLMSYFIYREVGWYGLLGVAVLLVSLPMQFCMGKLTAHYRSRTADQSGQRVRLITEILQAIQFIKFNTWEQLFTDRVDGIRKLELHNVRNNLFIRGLPFVFKMFTRVATFVTLVSYVYGGNAFTARQVFTVTTYFYFLYVWTVYFFALATNLSAEVLVSVRRIQKFLLLSEGRAEKSLESASPEAVLLPKEIEKSGRRIVNEKPKSVELLLKKATARWTGTGKGINEIDLTVLNRGLCAISGPVGCGKSSLLHVILGELELDAGEVSINGSLNFASQEPWLIEGTVRQNIVFVEPYDEDRYRQVVSACALDRDIDSFPLGDATNVGECGSCLSGGQRARINLARAVYRNVDIYLLDDPFSSVDGSVGKHIFENCITGLLKEKAIVLVTHHLQYLKRCEQVLFIADGQCDLEAKALFDSEKSLNFIDKSEDVSENYDGSFKDIKNPINEPDQEKFNNNKSVYRQYIAAAGKPLVLVVAISLIIAQITTSYLHIFLAEWSIWEDQINRAANPNCSNSNSTSCIETVFTDETRFEYLKLYIWLIFLILTFVILQNGLFVKMCYIASRKLHSKMLAGIMRAKMAFFRATPSGRILNRFSKDLDCVDTALPVLMMELGILALELLGLISVVALTNFWALFPTAFVIVAVYSIRRFYIHTARSLKGLEASVQSPIFSLANTTLQGLPTIRASRAQQYFDRMFNSHLDLSFSASYLCVATNRAFSVWVELTCIAYLAVNIALCFLANVEMHGGTIGLMITEMFSIVSMTYWVLRLHVDVDVHMIAVDRVLEYTKLDPEVDVSQQTQAGWPSSGAIRFEELTVRYSIAGSPVLLDFNLEICSGEKIGIVGRTGAGKSSIIQSLFRLAHNSGRICIDNLDIATIGLHDLRSKISIIPQDPFLFSGDIRKNLDPLGEFDDDIIWHTLLSVDLKTVVSQMPGGLEAKINDGGSNFSLGQRQLLCLARAMLRRNRILVMDEATASVDEKTDALIQNSIREQFAECTVLTIAHRMNSVMDCDRVLVMDGGRLVEIGSPSELLENVEGAFSQLFKMSGVKR